jgi:hypothetical protein
MEMKIMEKVLMMMKWGLLFDVNCVVLRSLLERVTAGRHLSWIPSCTAAWALGI